MLIYRYKQFWGFLGLGLEKREDYTEAQKSRILSTFIKGEILNKLLDIAKSGSIPVR